MNKAESLPRLLSATDLCKMIGTSRMTLHRWLKDDALKFPKPVRIKTNRYWPEHEVAEWLQGQRAA